MLSLQDMPSVSHSEEKLTHELKNAVMLRDAQLISVLKDLHSKVDELSTKKADSEAEAEGPELERQTVRLDGLEV